MKAARETPPQLCLSETAGFIRFFCPHMEIVPVWVNRLGRHGGCGEQVQLAIRIEDGKELLATGAVVR